VQSSSQIVATNKGTPSFLPARCPSCHLTTIIIIIKTYSDAPQPVLRSASQHKLEEEKNKIHKNM